mgnify:FL=1
MKGQKLADKGTAKKPAKKTAKKVAKKAAQKPEADDGAEVKDSVDGAAEDKK